MPNLNSETNTPDQERILIADDSEASRYYFSKILKNAGYEVIEARSGVEALSFIGSQPSLIILDIMLPDMSGLEISKQLKSDLSTSHIPIIQTSAALTQETDLVEGLDSGAEAYLIQPTHPKVLLSTVKSLLRLKKIEVERSQLLLKESATFQKYKDLVDSINHSVIWSIDPSTLTFTFVSPRAVEVTGFTKDEWMNTEGFWVKHLHPEDKEMALERFQEAFERAVDQGFEHRFLKANGEVIWFHTGVRLAQRGEGKGYELRGLSVDITRMKAAEAEKSLLLASEKRARAEAEQSRREIELQRQHLKLVIDAIPDFIAYIDLDERYLFVNRAYEILFSKDNEQVSGKLLRDVVGEEAYEATSAHLRNALRGKASSLEISHVLGSEERSFQVTFIPDFRGGKQVQGVVAVGHESTERKRINEEQVLARKNSEKLAGELQMAVQARDEFISIASHELKTPLTSLRLQAQIHGRAIRNNDKDAYLPARVDRLVSQTEKQVTRLTRLVDDMLDVSRIRSGRLNINPEHFNLCDVVTEVIERLRAQFLSESYPVPKVGHCLSAVGDWDRLRIEQVIMNLLTNAIRYGNQKPIEVNVDIEGEKVRLSVRDQGIGISESIKDKIFDRFERAVNANDISGLGLGLFITKQIVLAHHGRIWVESKFGKGSTFIVELPMKDPS